MPNNLEITITHPSGNQWDANPPNPGQGARVDNGGHVAFHVPQGGCTVCTSPSGAFIGQNGQCIGLNSDTTLQLSDSVNNSTINYCVCGPSETCPPVSTRLTGGYSIKAGS